jgi:hypothetical protein
LRVPQSSLYPFLNQRPLELRHGTDDLEHQPAGWGAQVQVVAEAHERHAIGAEIGQCVD